MDNWLAHCAGDSNVAGSIRYMVEIADSEIAVRKIAFRKIAVRKKAYA